jgi:hypothetical protein
VKRAKHNHVLNLLAITLTLIISVIGLYQLSGPVSAQGDGKKPPEIIKLGAEAKLGAVTFNHLAHATKYTTEGTAGIACVHCHHTAQPAAEAVKHPPHKTVWPADRTTTLTADLFDKDPNAPPVNDCKDCHARTGEKPKLLDAIPTIKGADGEPVVLNNQQAFHRNCAGCHDEVAKKKADTVAPTSKKCTTCHKKSAA